MKKKIVNFSDRYFDSNGNGHGNVQKTKDQLYLFYRMLKLGFVYFTKH
jgi:hypothetical protein